MNHDLRRRENKANKTQFRGPKMPICPGHIPSERDFSSSELFSLPVDNRPLLRFNMVYALKFSSNRRKGSVPEWLKGTGCKPVGGSLRRFESCPAHSFFGGCKKTIKIPNRSKLFLQFFTYCPVSINPFAKALLTIDCQDHVGQNGKL